MNLILFSGGIESTALLGLAKPSDQLLTVKAPYKNTLSGISNNYQQIADYYKLNVNYYESTALPALVSYEHQYNWLFVIAHLYALVYKPQELWLGYHSQETHQYQSYNIQRRYSYEQLHKMWYVLHPSIRINRPLQHLTKREQYQLIPQQLQTLTQSCYYQPRCNHCKKCQELDML